MGAGQGSLGVGTAVAESILVASVVFPVVCERISFTQAIGAELELGFRSLVPEFLRSLHAAVDLFDRRLDLCGGNRQSFLSVASIVHPVGAIAEVGQTGVPFLGRSFLAGGGDRRLEFAEPIMDAALPCGAGPCAVATPGRVHVATTFDRRCVDIR